MVMTVPGADLAGGSGGCCLPVDVAVADVLLTRNKNRQRRPDTSAHRDTQPTLAVPAALASAAAADCA